MNRFTAKHLSRRAFFRGSGVVLSLPMLDAMNSRSAFAAPAKAPRRMVLLNKALGIHGADFFPTQTGREYVPTRYLKLFDELRNDLTIVSGLSHPDVGGGHASEASFLTSARYPGTPAFKNTISLDQWIAEKIGNQTRHSFLAFGSHKGSLSWTRNGVQIPPDKDPVAVFRRLFIVGTPDEIREQERQLKNGHSILDSIRGETAALQQRVTAGDRNRLEQYFTAIREVEARLKNAEAWSSRPKPVVDAPIPKDYPDSEDIVGRTQMLLDLVHLALQTDSTRLVTFAIDVDGGVPPIEGVKETRHVLSHHGQDPRKIEQLRLIEEAELEVLNRFLLKLKGSQESEGNLLDHTMVLYGSNLGNASSHDTRNLPILLAGGGFQHGQHLSHTGSDNIPLANLFVSMLQRYGLEVDSFGTSTGTLRGLEFS